MKLRTLALLVLLFAIMLLLTATDTQAQPGPGSGWWSSLYVQNISSTSSTITSVALRAFASPTPQVEAFQAFQRSTDPIAPGSAIRLFPQEYQGWFLNGSFGPLPDDFEGSYLVNATQPVSTVVDLTNRWVAAYTGGYAYGTPDGRAVGQYQLTPFAWRDTTPYLYFPVVKRGEGANYKTSTLFLQNGSSHAFGVHVQYKCGAALYGQDTGPVQPWTSVAIVPPPDVPANTVCAAMVFVLVEGYTSRWTGLYTEHYVVESTATLLQTARALTDHDASMTLYAPVFKRSYVEGGGTRTTGLYLVNTTSTTVTAWGSFRVLQESGTGCSDITWQGPNLDIPGWSTLVYAIPSTVPSGCRGAVKFEATGNIVGMVSEANLNAGGNNPGNQSATIHSMIPSQAARSKVMFPVYKEKVWEGDWVRSSEITVQNASDSPADVWLVFTGIEGTGGTYTTLPQTVQPHGSLPFRLVSDPRTPSIWPSGGAMPLTGGTFAATVYSADPDIVGIATEASYFYNSADGHYYYCYGQSQQHPCPDRANYEGFNVP